MTKAELMAMVANMNDNDEVVFTAEKYVEGIGGYTVAVEVNKVEKKTDYEASETAKRNEVYTVRIADEKKFIAKLEVAMADDNKPTKAAEKRNAKRAEIIADSKKQIAYWEKMMVIAR